MSTRRLEQEFFKGELKGSLVLRLLKLARPHAPMLITFMISITITALIDSANTYMTRYFIDDGVMSGDKSKLLHYGFLYAGMFLVNSLNFFIFFTNAGRLGEKLQYDIRKKLFDHLQTLSFSFFDRTSSGWLLSRITSDSQRIAQLCSWMFLDIIWGSVNIIIALTFMATINLRLTLYVGLTAPILIFTAIAFKRLIITEYRKVRSMNSQITHAFSETIAGVRVVKAMTREGRNSTEFRKMAGDMHSASFRAGWLSALFFPLVQLIVTVGVAAIILAGGWEINIGGLTAGGFRAFIGYITFMMWPVQDLSRVFSEMQQSVASAERVFLLLDTKPEISDRPDALEAARFSGNIEFRNVDFHYGEGLPVLTGFNLKVKPGEMIALVGPTGAGKSTIVNLVARFYEPTGGQILFDGRDYRDYTQQALQTRIGVVLQHPHLFSGTVRENILYGNPEATEEEILAAVRMAHAEETILRLPGGFEEPVGEGGGLLSIGQRQLISLARVFIARPDLIIMDEATSAIDSLTEQHIQKGLVSLLKGRTSFVIAHRLSTIREADRILVIEGGKIAEEGSHGELLRLKKHYYELYTSQMRQERESALGLLG
jgi:ATP-binding cassette subfamily B protein